MLELKPGEPVVISGGARGITALVATELARTWRPTLLILGTTPLPEERESNDTAGLTGEAEIKAALHARLRREGRPGSPADIEKVYQVPSPRTGGSRKPGDPSQGRGRPSTIPRPTCATLGHWLVSWRNGAAGMGTPSG